MQLINLLSRGASGKVYHVRTEDGDYALKRIKHDHHGITVEAMREMILCQLNNKHIVHVYHVDFDVHATYLWLYLADMDLKTYIEHFNYSSYQLLHQLIIGLKACHSWNIMHRDLKPENILVYDDDDEIILKIADFGLATYDMIGCQSYDVVSLWYRAPEVLLHQPYHKSIDLWSLGCLFYELLTKKVLYRGHNEQDQLYLIQHMTIDNIKASDLAILKTMLQDRLFPL